MVSNIILNSFVKEIDDLAKQFAGAYISDGVPKSLTDKYTIQIAVKALATNAANHKIK